MPDFRFAVKVDLGTGMPTDWNTKSNWAMMLLQQGMADPKQVQEFLHSPIEMIVPQMQQGTPGMAGAQPGMNQGQGQPVPA